MTFYRSIFHEQLTLDEGLQIYKENLFQSFHDYCQDLLTPSNFSSPSSQTSEPAANSIDVSPYDFQASPASLEDAAFEDVLAKYVNTDFSLETSMTEANRKGFDNLFRLQILPETKNTNDISANQILNPSGIQEFPCLPSTNGQIDQCLDFGWNLIPDENCTISENSVRISTNTVNTPSTDIDTFINFLPDTPENSTASTIINSPQYSTVSSPVSSPSNYSQFDFNEFQNCDAPRNELVLRSRDTGEKRTIVTSSKPKATNQSSKRDLNKTATYKKWTAKEDALLHNAVAEFGSRGKWSLISTRVPGRTPIQCSTRWMGALNPSIHKGKWTAEEDETLLEAYREYAEELKKDLEGSSIPWQKIAERIPGRTQVQCIARYQEALDPDVRKGRWSKEEDALLISGLEAFGCRWVKIAKRVPGRTQRQCRTRWLQLRPKLELKNRNLPEIDNDSDFTDRTADYSGDDDFDRKKTVGLKRRRVASNSNEQSVTVISCEAEERKEVTESRAGMKRKNAC